MSTRKTQFSEIVIASLFVCVIVCGLAEKSDQSLWKPKECVGKCLDRFERSYKNVYKVSRFFSCYRKCWNDVNRGTGQQVLSTNIAEQRARRAALPSNPNCPESSPTQTEDWSPKKLNVNFGRYENTSHWYVNVSWTSMNDTYGKWNGTLVSLVVPPSDDFWFLTVNCSVYPKNQTFVQINISAYHYHHPGRIFLQILGLPYSPKQVISRSLSSFTPDMPPSPTSRPTPIAQSMAASVSGCSFSEESDLVWYPAKVDVDFLQRNNTDWYANISWTPLTDPTVRWTGYLITTFFGDTDPVRGYSIPECFKVPKNKTFMIIDSSNGWECPKTISLNVTAFPLKRIEVASMTDYPPPKPNCAQSTTGKDSTTSSPHSLPVTNTTTSSPHSLPVTNTTTSSPHSLPVTNTTTSSPHSLPVTNTTTSSPHSLPVEGTIPSSPRSPRGKSDVVTTVFSSVGGVLFLIALIALLLLYRRYKHTPGKATSSQKSFKYHAFLIYSMRDAELANMLMTVLESYGLKCCVHWRDFIPGRDYAQNIVESIENSFKVIAVMSSNFLQSQCCNYELQQTVHRLMNRGDDCIILIILDTKVVKNIPPTLLNRSYIDFTNLTDKSTWQRRLLDTLSKAVIEQEDDCITDTSSSSNSSSRTNNSTCRSISVCSSTGSEGTALITPTPV